MSIEQTQPAAQPVALVRATAHGMPWLQWVSDEVAMRFSGGESLYAAPQEGQALSDEQIDAMAYENCMYATWYENAPKDYCLRFARALLAASQEGLT